MYSSKSVAIELAEKIGNRPNEIVVGSDKWFLKVMPLVPEKFRFILLDIMSK